CARHNEECKRRVYRLPASLPPPDEGLSLQLRARRGHELAAGRIAVVRRLCERCLGDGVEGFGEVLPGIREARWRIVQVREEDGQLTLAVEGPRTGETF